jgi:hypothetical protein
MSAPVLNTAGNSTPGRLGCVDLNLGTPLAPSGPRSSTSSPTTFNPDDGAFVDATVFGDAGFSGRTSWAPPGRSR